MSVLITGSLAYDTIMVYPGHFKNDILQEKVHILNVSFLVPEMRREFGGCAGNIVYNLHLLGGDAVPMGTVGHDFGPYRDWMSAKGIEQKAITQIDGAFTAQAYITTDLDDNQITAFHPGAMNDSHTQAIQAEGVSLGTVSPDGRGGMLLHAQQFADAEIPFLFDPGQGLPMFNGEELRHFLSLATYVVVNSYEAEMLSQRTELSLEEIAERVDALVVTNGGKGSQIYAGGQVYEIPCARAESLADPTGCGDAYRGGLLYGISRGLDWETTGRVASLMGAIKIERPGTQNHSFDMESFRARYQREFRRELP